MDKTNLEVRYAMTPRGKGTYVGVDDKEDPRVGVFQFEKAGYQAFSLDDCEEVEE